MSHGSLPPNTALNIDALISLVELAKNPQWIDRLKELQAAQQASDDSAEESRERSREATALLKRYETLKAELDHEREDFEILKRGNEASSAILMDEMVNRENAVKNTERVIKQQAEEFRQQSDEKADELLHRETAVEDRERRVLDKENDVRGLEAILKKRLAKLKAAMD